MTSRITNAFVQIFVAIQKRKKIGTKEDETINADFVTELPNHYRNDVVPVPTVQIKLNANDAQNCKPSAACNIYN